MSIPHSFPRLPLALSCALALSVPVLLSVPASVHAQQAGRADTHDFDIPAGELGPALNRLATASGISLGFEPALVAGRQSRGLRGRYGTREALTRLLDGTGLTWHERIDGAIAIERIPDSEDGVIVTNTLSVDGAGGVTRLARDGVSDATSYTSRGVEVAGKIPRTLREIPQSVSVLTEQRMRDQGLVDAVQALSWVAGVVNYRADESESPLLYSRGFQLNNISVDGSLAGTSFWQLPADLSAYDQVEVLRGPNGMFAGSGNSGSPGGQINMTRKRPLADPHLNLEFAAGSWDQYRATVDVNRPLTADGRLRGRGVVSYLDRKFHYARGARENWMLYGVLEYDMTDALTITAGIENERRDAVHMVSGLPLRGDGSYPGWSRSTSTIVPWSTWGGDTLGSFFEMNYAFGENWKAKLLYNQRQERLDWDFAWATGYVDPIAGSSQNPLYVTSNWRHTNFKTRAAEINVTGKFELFGRMHDVVIGAEISKEKTRNQYQTNLPYSWSSGVVNQALVDQETLDLSSFPWVAAVYDPQNVTMSPYNTKAAYLNLRMRLLDPLTLTAGSRINSYEYGGSYNVYRGYVANGAYKKSGIHTPFAALTWDFSKSTSVYLSYTDIFRVSNSYTWPAAEMVEPVTGTNLEFGLKSEFMDGRLLGSLAIYRTQLENQTRVNPDAPYPCPASPTGGYCYIADNQQRVKGVDLELNGQLTENWKISLGATWLEKEYTRWLDATGAPADRQGTSWGLDTPDRMLKVWSDYRLPGAASNWRVGAGFRVQSEIYSERDATATVPGVRVTQGGYAVWDAMVAWDASPTWGLQLNANNIFDKHYFSMVGTSAVTWGEPANVMLTLRVRM